MITIEAFERFAAIVQRLTGWRKGQTYFNLAYEIAPDATNSLRGTSVDPFYQDANILKFGAKLVEKGVLIQ